MSADLGGKIKALRKQAGMTQEELGTKLGLVKSTISLYESGKSNPDDNIKSMLADLFDVSIDYLLGRSGNVSHVNYFEDNGAVRINVYGSIPAGKPIGAIEDIRGWEEIPNEWLKGGKKYIALIVNGDSMYPKYLDGDTIIVQLQPDCESGEDCVCYVNDYDATLKRVKKDGNKITLQPINPNYPPQTYSYPGEVTILGVVKELRRKI